jgi:hypothetical protein
MKRLFNEDPFNPTNPTFPEAEKIGDMAILGVRRAQEAMGYSDPNHLDSKGHDVPLAPIQPTIAPGVGAEYKPIP